MNAEVMPGAETIEIKGNNTCVLLIHGGGGGTTADLKEISHYLYDQAGYSVLAPLLPGFGTKPEDLILIQSQEWIDFIQNKVEDLQSKYQKLYIFGHSMGSVLAAIMAERNDIGGLICVSPPLKLKPLLQFGIKLIFLLKLFRIKYIKRDVKNLKQKSDGNWVGYDRLPVNIATKIQRLTKIMKQGLDRITVPCCIIYGKKDDQINLKSPERLYRRIKSEVKEIHWIEDADHAIFFHHRKNELFQLTLEFIRKIEQG